MDSLGCGSGSGSLVEIELCGQCGEPLGDKPVAFYDGENWRKVHSACVPED